jgi:ABC-2 type transport system ATP-binding protein
VPAGRAGESDPARFAIWTESLTKTFRRGLGRRPVTAISGVDLRVPAGEIFGFLGPNGAGKSTTIRILTGTLLPTSGHAVVAGQPAGSRRSRARIGYLPENPPLALPLTAQEFLRLSGRLVGMPSRALRDEVARLIALFGLESFRDRPLQRLSKGQQQLVGIAHAVLGGPPLLILDEPMSGLDPVARKIVRDHLLDLRARGRTIFLSSHILSDVELLCSRVGILSGGRLLRVCAMDEVIAAGTDERELVIAGIPAGDAAALVPEAADVRPVVGDRVALRLSGDLPLGRILGRVAERGARIVSLTSRGGSLEEFVVERILSGKGPRLEGGDVVAARHAAGGAG